MFLNKIKPKKGFTQIMLHARRKGSPVLVPSTGSSPCISSLYSLQGSTKKAHTPFLCPLWRSPDPQPFRSQCSLYCERQIGNSLPFVRSLALLARSGPAPQPLPAVLRLACCPSHASGKQGSASAGRDTSSPNFLPQSFK